MKPQLFIKCGEAKQMVVNCNGFLADCFVNKYVGRSAKLEF